jgi:hypothetical protein
MGWLVGFFDELRCNIDSEHAARRILQALDTDALEITHKSIPSDASLAALNGDCSGAAWGGDDQ